MKPIKIEPAQIFHNMRDRVEEIARKLKGDECLPLREVAEEIKCDEDSVLKAGVYRGCVMNLFKDGKRLKVIAHPDTVRKYAPPKD